MTDNRYRCVSLTDSFQYGGTKIAREAFETCLEGGETNAIKENDSERCLPGFIAILIKKLHYQMLVALFYTCTPNVTWNI